MLRFGKCECDKVRRISLITAKTEGGTKASGRRSDAVKAYSESQFVPKSHMMASNTLGDTLLLPDPIS
jgi:hypothetical protein